MVSRPVYKVVAKMTAFSRLEDHGPAVQATAQDDSSSAPRQESELETFPIMDTQTTTKSSGSSSLDSTPQNRDRSSTLQDRVRRVSKAFSESAPPTGMWLATGQAVSSIPTMSDIRRAESPSRQSWGEEDQDSSPPIPRKDSDPGDEELEDPQSRGWDEESNRGRTARQDSSTSKAKPVVEFEKLIPDRDSNQHSDRNEYNYQSSDARGATKSDGERTTPFENGYEFPPKHNFQQTTKIFLKAAWKFVKSPMGFLITIYGLNVVAWGGMLFLLMCKAAPAMCTTNCDDIMSPRRIWIEIDSQILNALFCVTAFGLIPWRFRDLYYLLQYRVCKNQQALRRLAGINRGWFRLKGSDDVPVQTGPANIDLEMKGLEESTVPFPLAKIPDPPLTGNRAPPTAMWKLDFVIWAMVLNTFLQAVLCGFMWGMNRFNRPSWSTGTFVALASLVAGIGGAMAGKEGKNVKSIEGVPVSDEDLARLKRDRELGITHYNNIKDEKPKTRKEKNKSEEAEDHVGQVKEVKKLRNAPPSSEPRR